MDRQQIVIFLDSSQLGGIETHVTHLARGLDQAGYTTKILFFKRYAQAHPLEALLHQHNIAFEYLNEKPDNLYQWLKKRKPLLLHTHGYKAGILGRISARLTSTPVVSTFHNGDQGSGLVRLYTWLDQQTSRLSTNIAVSPDIANRLPKPSTLMNNFIEMPERDSKPGSNIAFVGRLSHEKGPDLFMQLAKHQSDLYFNIYGSGPMLSSLEAMHPDNVKLHGQVSNMETFWNDIGLLCITSRQEGLPLVALEAMAHGIPVLAFQLGALPGLIQPGINGWLVQQGNLKDMHQKLRLWYELSSSDKSKMARACVQTISNHYSCAAVIPEVLTIYQQAVTARGQEWYSPRSQKQPAGTTSTMSQ